MTAAPLGVRAASEQKLSTCNSRPHCFAHCCHGSGVSCCHRLVCPAGKMRASLEDHPFLRISESIGARDNALSRSASPPSCQTMPADCYTASATVDLRLFGCAESVLPHGRCHAQVEAPLIDTICLGQRRVLRTSAIVTDGWPSTQSDENVEGLALNLHGQSRRALLQLRVKV